jgi:long-chain acyl-CoA synthetase
MPHTTDIIDPKTAFTLAGLFRERVRRTPHACAYRYFSEKENRFEGITWEKMFDLAGRWQAALRKEGLLSGDRVALMLKNRLEWVLLDLAALGLGLVTVPLFANDRPEHCARILMETDSRLILIEGEAQLTTIEQVSDISNLKRIISVQPIFHLDSCSETNRSTDEEGTRKYPSIVRQEVSTGVDAIGYPSASWKCGSLLCELRGWLPENGEEYAVNCREPADMATIVYTSGTTGMPKGVMLSHANILENAFACLQREPIYPDDLFLSFLPLSHTFERTVGYYVPMMSGACVAYVRSIDKLPEDLLEVHPTILTSVPRIYERIHERIRMELDEKTALSRLVFNLTVKTGWERFLHRQGRAGWSPLLLLWPLLNKIVARRVMTGLGGRLRLSISGGAALALSVAKVFIGLGLNLLQGYGLTETSPVISFNTTDDNNPATVGRLLPGIESAVAPDGELLVRGPNVMLGYWRGKAATEAVIDQSGWFHTGDLARTDENGHLIIVGRLKEIIVLSTGEKVPPEDLELAIKMNPLFEQVMVVGEGRPFLAALAVLNPLRWKKLAARHRIPSNSPELLASEKVQTILLMEIGRRIGRFPGFARIRRVYATFHPWKMQDGLITATLKLRRRELLTKFKGEVEELFKGH